MHIRNEDPPKDKRLKKLIISPADQTNSQYTAEYQNAYHVTNTNYDEKFTMFLKNLKQNPIKRESLLSDKDNFRNKDNVTNIDCCDKFRNIYPAYHVTFCGFCGRNISDRNMITAVMKATYEPYERHSVSTYTRPYHRDPPQNYQAEYKLQECDFKYC